MRIILIQLWAKLTGLFLIATLAACGPQQAAEPPESADRFATLGADGQPSMSTSAACVLDSRTGLTWERKSSQAGPRDWQNTYSWYDPDEAHHEQDYRGQANAGACAGSDCDTWSMVNATNSEVLCGYEDWRLPSRDELFSISDLTKAASPPTVDEVALPLTQSAEYWSANDYSFQPDSAWTWSFFYGHDRVDWKRNPKYVRLVRGEATDLTAVKE